MADYYSILNRTISGLGENTDRVRELVYGKARTAIEKQLRAMDPPPSDAAISKQMGLLEESILRVEAEYVPAPALAEEQTQEAEREADPGADEKPDGKPEPEPEPVSETAPAISSTSEETPVDDVKPTAEPVMPEPDTPVPVDTADTVEPAAIDQAPPPVASLDPDPQLQPLAARDDVPPPKVGSSDGIARSIGRFIPYLLVLMLLGGGAYALWLNKDSLNQAYEDFVKKDEVVSEVVPDTNNNAVENEEPASEEETQIQPPVEEEAEPEEPESVRLGANGEDIAAEPVKPQEVDTVAETDIPLILEPEPEIAEPAGEVEPVVEAGDETQNASNEVQPAPNPAVAETAYLYEEGDAGVGAERNNGSIIWSLINESPGNGLPVEPVIMAEFNIPEKALSMILKIRRNTDEALSASHIIELQFDSPENFAGGKIDNVARFVMKTTEQARGEGLVAVPVRVQPGFFLIALNNLEQAVATNTRLLMESNWIDIPLGYTSGRRALVAFEKGDKGELVFQQAFADWKNR